MISALLIAALMTQAPGSTDRETARGAITAAKNAIDQAKNPQQRDAATARLKEAQGLFEAEKYADAAKTADSAWKLVSADWPSKFEVEVKADGQTRVSTREGGPVRVEAGGVTRPTYAGQTVTVAKGEAPKFEEQPLAAPEPLAPKDAAAMKFKASQKLLGPIVLSWRAVGAAKAYEVELRPEKADDPPVVMTVKSTTAKVPGLSPGRYLWTVRAVDSKGGKSEAAAARSFELSRDKVKIEVQGTTWK